MNKIIIVLLCFASINICYAQRGFQEGFIVTNNQDTLYGTIRDRKEGVFIKLYESIRFKKQGKGRARKYSPNQIMGYYRGNRLFESVKESALNDGFLGRTWKKNDSGDKIFLRVILKGEASYYQLEWIDQDDSGVETIDYIKKENNPVFMRSTQGLFGLKRKMLAAYFSDCPPLVSKIQNKELKTSQEVVDFYNSWVADQVN